MNTYILDIETRPQQGLIEIFESDLKPPANYKSEEAIEKWRKNYKAGTWKALAVNPHYCEIRMVGIKKLGEEPKILTLAEFADWINKQDSCEFISYNGVAFDFPAIIRAGIKNNLSMPYGELNKLTERYQKGYGKFMHRDLILILNQYGKFESLDKMLQIYLGIKKKEINFETCTLEELKDHCIEDLCNTELLYRKFKDIIN